MPCPRRFDLLGKADLEKIKAQFPQSGRFGPRCLKLKLSAN
jgi:hypothetical protein